VLLVRGGVETLDESEHERKEKLVAALCAVKACPASGKREAAGSSIGTEEFRESLLLVQPFTRKDSDTRSNMREHARVHAIIRADKLYGASDFTDS
jgi:hypothetical protein